MSEFALICQEGMEIAVGESDMEAYKGCLLKLPYLSVFICLKGKAIVQVNFEKYILAPSDILVLSEDSLAQFLNTSEDFKLFHCLIDKELASEIAYKLPNSLFSFLWKSPVCSLRETEKPLLQAWIEITLYIIRECTVYKRSMIVNHLQNLFLQIAERAVPIISGDFIKRKYSHKEILCWRFWDLIGKYCKQHRDVAFYARQLCITPFYLSQIAKKFMNDSPKGLIERQVILEMKALLISSHISIKEIAVRLNFDDPSYMCRFFKRHTGISLMEYKKTCT